MKDALNELPHLRLVWRSFLIVLGFAIVAIWAAISWAYSARLTARDEELRLSKAEVAAKESELASLRKGGPAASNQLGTPVEWSDALVTVADRTFTNEAVELDGKHFVRCSFTNVTMIYRGKGPVSFVDAKFHFENGQSYLLAQSTPVNAFQSLENYFKTLPGLTYQEGLKNLDTGELRATTPLTVVAPSTPHP